MIAPDRTPVRDRSPVSRRVTPDPATQKIAPATTATAGSAAAEGSAAAAAVGDQDGDGGFGLSAIQIVASTAAAVTAALIGSRLGVAGTLTGAALASIVSAVGAAVYGHSLLVTRRHMTRALRLVRPAGATPATPAAAITAAADTPAVAGRRSSRPTVPGSDDPTVVIPRAGLPAASARRRSRRPLTVVLAAAAAAVAVFAASLATVTLVETVKGGPLSGGSGLTVRGGNTAPGPRPTTDPTHGDGDLLDLAGRRPGRVDDGDGDGDGDTDPDPEPDPVIDPHCGLRHRRPHGQRPVHRRQRTAQHPSVRGLGGRAIGGHHGPVTAAPGRAQHPTAG